MVFLHPAFTIVTLILVAFSFLEVYNYKNYKSVWGVVGIMILLIGFRNWVGADYKPYVEMYLYYGENASYDLVFNKALFGKENLDIEWLYVLLGKLIYSVQLPFFIFTFVVAILSVGLKYFVFEKTSVYPALSMLLYMFPSYFTADGGHMRQALSMALLMMSFLFISKRNLFAFLFIIYIAMGFHKSAAIFIFAYWLVLLPLNPKRILILVGISMFLSPFQVYEYISILDSIAPAEIYKGFEAYESIEEANKGNVKFTDLLCIMYIYFLVVYDKEACAKIPYYEYMRNIGVIGVCMYFIFRGSPIFSSRLSANYMIFMVMVLPNIVASIHETRVQRFFHLFLVTFALFYYFVFASMHGGRAGYNVEGYINYLW